ncbi:MAG: ATP-binding protein [Candidatus Aminicenantes bacterium]|nr:ATP-binding protein [Candidatus Aminicenantes bacterium]
MKYEIIGRKEEIKKLDEIFASREAEFVAIYGRRRVGKTYLVHQYFNAKPCAFFEITGLKNGALNTQLELFTRAIEESFYQGKISLAKPKRWLDALKLLTDHLKDLPKNKAIVLFFDELPWLATRKSGILEAIDYYWNTQWSRNPMIKLIVCGSAASWMLEKVIYAKGGLYNRMTARLHLLPFTLKEAQDYLKYRGIQLNEEQVLELYMVMGGIPHYLKAVSRGLSAAQNINKICFEPEGLLLDEFDQLFASLFDRFDAHLEIIQALAQTRYGLSRDELLTKIQQSSSGGTFKERLLELEAAGFITGFTPYGYASKGTYYRIIDEYTLFYLNWVRKVRGKLLRGGANYWESKAQSQAWKSWAGYAYEAVCFKHIRQVSRALGIEAISKEIGSWRYFPSSEESKAGAQVDLLLDRVDGIINICEIKHYNKKFIIDKSYANQLKYKMETFSEQAKTRKQLFLTMITVHGLVQNDYAKELAAGEITLKDLFK